MNIYWTLILLWHFLNVVNARKIEWLPTSTYVIKNITSNGIFCHAGTPKTIEKLWWTLEIQVKVISGEVTLYSAGSPEAVFDYECYIEEGSKFHALSIDPFNTACVVVNFTDNNQHANHGKFHIRVLLTSVDHWRVRVMALGMTVIFASAFLTRNPVVFYLCVSILVPIFLFVPILNFFYQRSITYCVLISTLLIACVTFLEYKYFYMYVLVTGVIGFLVAYRIGPPDYHPRSKNIMMWLLQGAGVIIIRWSTWYEGASIFIAIFALGITYILPCIRKGNGKQLSLPL